MQTQSFDPWGAVRNGGVSSTEFNYTNQRKDDGTGLLFYNARYYDPALARFVSADSIVPNTSHRSLTVDFHEMGFRASLGGENNQGFWFQMNDDQRQNATAPWGTPDPQELNRYSYVNNNPLRYSDLSGHKKYSKERAIQIRKLLRNVVKDLQSVRDKEKGVMTVGGAAAGAFGPGGKLIKYLRPVLGSAGGGLIAPDINRTQEFIDVYTSMENLITDAIDGGATTIDLFFVIGPGRKTYLVASWYDESGKYRRSSEYMENWSIACGYFPIETSDMNRYCSR